MAVILISLSHWGMHEVPVTCGVREFIRTYCGDSTRAVEILEDDGPISSPFDLHCAGDNKSQNQLLTGS